MKQVAALLTAILIFIIIAPCGFIMQMFYSGRKDYLINVAVGIDQTGNAVCPRLFNAALRKDNGYPFGNCDETISRVLGMNKQLGTLTVTGKLLCMLLNKIDKNHVENSI